LKNEEKLLSRRRFIQASLAGSAALLGLPRLSSGKSSPSSDRPPNFIIILADDLGYQDLGCFGSPLIKTPNLDRMAAEGAKFTSFYAAPSCTPSRAGLLTGCYPMRVSLPRVLNPRDTIGISSKEITLAQLLKTRGYATCCIGKWHLGHLRPFLPTRHGFDHYFGLPYSNDMSADPKIKPSPPLMRDERIIELPAKTETLTERYTEEAIKFITENKDQPFFLYLPHTFPHTPLAISERFKGKSARGLYGDVVECIDWSAGRILDTLKKLGLDKNTIVVFFSDNGPWLIRGENGGSALPLRAGKGTTYEGGVREPCIMWWPGHIPAGSVCSEMACNMDLYPTFAKLAGAKAPTDRIIDGKDIWSLMAGVPGAKTPHDVFFYYRNDRLEAVRSGKWKLILERTEGRAQLRVPTALYDLDADISEEHDLSASYPKVVKRLQVLAEECREDLGDIITGRTGKNVRPSGKV